MGDMTMREKCEVGCTCNKHSRSGAPGQERVKCPSGCTCKKHARAPKIDWKDPEARKAYAREYARKRYEANPELFRQRVRESYAKNPRPGGRRADDSLRYLYGLTAERVAQMAVEQGGLCYLCGEPLDFSKKRAVHVDHDHNCCRGLRSCGTCIRGLACSKCNAGIGHFADDPDRMRRVADNLEMANRRLRSQQPVQALIPLAGDDAAAVTPRGEEMS